MLADTACLTKEERILNLMNGDGSSVVPFVRGIVSQEEDDGKIRPFELMSWDGEDLYYIGHDLRLTKFKAFSLDEVSYPWPREVSVKALKGMNVLKGR